METPKHFLERVIMSTPALYIFAITIWGSTWYSIKLQLGVVPPEISIAYRFIAASLILFSWGFIRRKPFYYPPRLHFMFILQGLGMFSLGYFCAYYAGGLINSGLNAVLFSTIVFFNIFNSALFFKTKISPLTLVGALIGFGGLCLVFLPEIMAVNTDSQQELVGMGLAVLGGLIGSFGNMVSSSVQKEGVGVMQGNAFSMAYGGLISLITALALGKPLVFDTSFTYVSSLLYLASFGSIFAFGCYLSVLGRVGPEKAALPMVMIPVVALIISEFFEDHIWSSYAVFGIFLMLFGNIAVTTKGKMDFIKKCLKILTR